MTSTARNDEDSSLITHHASLVRPSAIAGTWYPGGAGELTSTVDGLLAQAEPQALSGRIRALLAPHAGYLYSGAVAAVAFRQVQDLPFRRVCVLSPSHHPYGAHVLLPDVAGYETPLGVVPVDRMLLADAAARLGDLAQRVSGDTEHSLEIQLPFLQRCLGAFSLLPVMLERQTLACAAAVARALVDSLRAAGGGEDTLLVASADLSHYRDYRVALRLDRALLQFVGQMDAAGLLAAVAAGEVESCGAGVVGAMLLAARELGASGARVLHYANSGDVTGDIWRVVGYGAAVIF